MESIAPRSPGATRWGGAVSPLLSEKCPTPGRRMGVNEDFGLSGPAAALLKQFGLSAEHIVEVARDFCGR